MWPTCARAAGCPQDLYLLCDAQRRGALPDEGNHPFSEVLHALSAEVQKGQLGTVAQSDAQSGAPAIR